MTFNMLGSILGPSIGRISAVSCWFISSMTSLTFMVSGAAFFTGGGLFSGCMVCSGMTGSSSSELPLSPS